MNTLQNLILSNEDETLNREVKAYQEKLTSKTSGCPFAIWMGNKIHIIRKKLDKYTETHNRI